MATKLFASTAGHCRPTNSEILTRLQMSDHSLTQKPVLNTTMNINNALINPGIPALTSVYHQRLFTKSYRRQFGLYRDYNRDYLSTKMT